MPSITRSRKAAMFISDRSPAEITAEMLGRARSLKEEKLESYSLLEKDTLRNDIQTLMKEMQAQTKADIDFINGLAMSLPSTESEGGPMHFHVADSELFDHTFASVGALSASSAPADVLMALIVDSDKFMRMFDLVCHEYPGTLLEAKFHELYLREHEVKEKLEARYDHIHARDY